MIYSMVVLELAFAMMRSPIVAFKYLFNDLGGDRDASLANSRFVALLYKVRFNFRARIAIGVHVRVSLQIREIITRKICGYFKSPARIDRANLLAI